MNTYRALKEDGLDLGKATKIFAVMVKYVTPILILLLEIFGIRAKFGEYLSLNLNFIWVLLGAVLLMGIGIAVYFIFFRNSYTGTNEDELLLEKGNIESEED
jgi:hypothetical protein